MLKGSFKHSEINSGFETKTYVSTFKLLLGINVELNDHNGHVMELKRYFTKEDCLYTMGHL